MADSAAAESSTSNTARGTRKLAIDLDDTLHNHLDFVLDWLEANRPYRPTKRAVVTRGVELACEELAEMHGADVLAPPQEDEEPTPP